MSAQRIDLKLGKVLVATIAVFCACAGAARDARATLGGDVASVEANQKRLGGARLVKKLPSGERHELTLPSGIVIHEYVSAAAGGAVYAITWRGPRMPDLRELLGAYFAQLSSRDSKGGHHQMNLTGADLVIQSAGHGHTFSGRAWVPSLVPTGVVMDASLE